MLKANVLRAESFSNEEVRFDIAKSASIFYISSLSSSLPLETALSSSFTFAALNLSAAELLVPAIVADFCNLLLAVKDVARG
jgi:hypothetical protein